MPITDETAEMMFEIFGANTLIVDGALAIPWHVVIERSRRIDIIGFACSDHDCCHLAMFRVFWPGRTSLKCPRHAMHWATVANAMGFDLQMKAIDVVTGDDDWSKRISLLEYC